MPKYRVAELTIVHWTCISQPVGGPADNSRYLHLPRNHQIQVGGFYYSENLEGSPAPDEPGTWSWSWSGAME